MSPVTLLTNIALSAAGTSGQTSTVGEPSVAKSGQKVFFTGNWYAARSADLGATWTHVDPFSVLPPVDGGFCCDQTVIHVPGKNIFVWLLQYIKQNGSNTLRIAVRKASTLNDDVWAFWDLRPATANPAWTNQWFDFNHAARSNNFLYVSTNVYGATDDRWKRAVVFRLPLAVLAAQGSLTFDVFSSTTNGTLRLTQGAKKVMYFGSPNSASQIRVFSWPESSTAVASTDVNVSQWNDGAYVANCPDGRNWLGRCDDRMTAGWVSKGIVGFGWSANKLGTARPQPYVRIVRLKETTKAVVNEPDIWHTDFAYAYPDTALNSSGAVGLSLFRGGGPRFPGHVVGAWDSATNSWALAGTRDSTHTPNDGKWGDYVTCRRDSPDTGTWVAVGFTLQGGGARSNIEPRLVRFKR